MSAHRILVIEDDPVVARDLADQLRGFGYEVAGPAGDGDTGLEMARSEHLDLALVDIRIPGGRNGVDLCETIQVRQGIPVLLMSAYSDEEVFAAARRIGAYGYLFKPFTEDRLRTAVELALERSSVEQELARSRERYRLLVERSLTGVVEERRDGTIIRCNSAFAGLLGYASVTEVASTNMDDHYADAEEATSHREELLESGAVRAHEVRLRRQDGSTVWVLDSAVVVQDRNPGPAEIIRTLVDISERKALEAGLERMAYHDELTGLPNRWLLKVRADQALALADRRGETVAVAYLDLVDFKAVNDQHGHGVGDALLEKTARRLQKILRTADTVARIGGDEFVILLSSVDDREAALNAVRRLLGQISRPVTVKGVDVALPARAGVALYPHHGRSLEGLLEAADTALIEAKKREGAAISLASEPGAHLL